MSKSKKEGLTRRSFMKFLSGSAFAGFATKIVPEINLLGKAKDDNDKLPSIREATKREYDRFVGESEAKKRFSESLPKEFRLSTADPFVTILNDSHANVTYSIEGGAGYNYFAEIFDYKSAELTRTMSKVNHLRADGRIRTVDTDNDAVIMDIVVTQEGKVLEGFVIDSNNKRRDAVAVSAEVSAGTHPAPIDTTQRGYWDFINCFNDCLALNGVPVWLITGVGIICAVACAVTVGWGCFVCLNAVVAGYTTITTWCWLECQWAYHL